MTTAAGAPGEPRRIQVIEREQLIGRARGEVFAFFADALNLETLTPPWLHFGVRTPAPIEMRTGAEIAYRMRVHGVPVGWLTRIEEWEPDTRPYRLWHHTHTFEELDGATLMRDRVRYTIPLGPLGRAAEAIFVRRDLETIFDFRRDTVARLLG
jgi:ligand-binding SRPBCC domain-containing protein